METPIDSTPTAVSEQFFGILGLAKRAGKTVHGTDMICEKMRAKKKPVLVLVSHTASDGTRERLRKKCGFYGVPLREIAATTERLGQLLAGGGLCAAVALTDSALADRLMQECK